jgi:hypothetical protein
MSPLGFQNRFRRGPALPNEPASRWFAGLAACVRIIAGCCTLKAPQAAADRADHRPLEQSPGGPENAVRPCFIDLSFVHRLRAFAEARCAPASGCAGKARTGRRRGPAWLHLQRRVDFTFAGRLPGRHGARTASAANSRAGTDQSRSFHRRSADGLSAVTPVMQRRDPRFWRVFCGCSPCRTTLVFDGAPAPPDEKVSK